MRPISEMRALFVAIAVSTGTIAAAFGFAWLMRLSHIAATFQLLGTAQAAVAPAVSLPPEAIEGRHLFLMNCAHCHGDDARGDEGPDLHDVRKSDQRIHQLISNGVKGEMPSFAKKLNESEIRAVTAYLRTLHS